MEDIFKSQEHKRDFNGNVIVDNPARKQLDSIENSKIKQTLFERRLMFSAAAFLCIFSVMVILLATTVSSKAAMSSKLEDMTDLYNYQLSVNTKNSLSKSTSAELLGEELQFASDDPLDVSASSPQVLTWVKMRWVLNEILPDFSGESQS